jgi:putative ABC transport system permease protein
MGVIWGKVWRDLWHSKFRTFLVVSSTAVGVFALGFVYGTSGVLHARLTESHRASIPPHITLLTGTFSQDIVDTIRHEPGIADAEGEVVASIRWKLDGEENWRDGLVIGRADYEAQRMYLFDLLDGDWPTGRTLAVERLSSRSFRIPIGTTIVVKFGRSERRLPVEGIMRHPQTVAPPLGSTIFFATPETVAWLTGQPEGFGRLHVRLESFSEEEANAAGERLTEQLEGMGVGVGFYVVTDPQVHPVQETADALLLILKVLGALSLGLSGFLIVNMMNAIIVQQVWQIGVMKVVGATAGQVMRVYLATALIYGLLSLFLAVPLGIAAAHLLASVLLSLFNVAVGPFRVIPGAVFIQIAVGLVVPLLTALVPVIGGARITPHQAISTYGLGAGFGRNWLDRLIGRIRFLPRRLALSLRNTFRRKARVALTLITLVFGGAMFIGVMSVGSSMNKTLEVILNDFGFDVLVVFGRLYRETPLVEVAESVPGVTRAEVWDQRAAQLALVNGDDREVYVWGVPPDSVMFSPNIIDGRGLLPADDRAILLNSKIAADEGIRVGDVVTLTIGERESTWTVVGLVLNVNNLQRDNFVSFDALARTIGTVNRGAVVMVMSERHDAATQQRLIRDLRAAYTARRMEPAQLQSAAEVRQMNQIQFNVITVLMMVMAVLAAVVGSVGLTSTMSINVVERGREIGVMRAVGATSVTIIGIFIAEGVLVGVLSWLLAVPLSYPVGLAFSNLVSQQLFRIPLDFDYSVAGMVLWLMIAVVLSAVASLWPALRATQVSVREALAYE